MITRFCNARLVEALDRARYLVGFLLDVMVDPSDRDTAQSGDEGGVYNSDELAATQDIYVDVVRGIEKQRWMLQAHLARR
jgi:hypothetical protein